MRIAHKVGVDLKASQVDMSRPLSSHYGDTEQRCANRGNRSVPEWAIVVESRAVGCCRSEMQERLHKEVDS